MLVRLVHWDVFRRITKLSKCGEFYLLDQDVVLMGSVIPLELAEYFRREEVMWAHRGIDCYSHGWIAYPPTMNPRFLDGRLCREVRDAEKTIRKIRLRGQQ